MSFWSFFIGYLVGVVTGVVAMGLAASAARGDRDQMIASDEYIRELRRKKS